MPVSNRFAARLAIPLSVVGAVVALGAMLVRSPRGPAHGLTVTGHRRRVTPWRADENTLPNSTLSNGGRIPMDGDNAFQLFMKGASGHRLYRAPMP